MQQFGKPVGFCQHAHDIPLVTAKSMAEAALSGDPAATEVYRICFLYLGRALAVFIDMLNLN